MKIDPNHIQFIIYDHPERPMIRTVAAQLVLRVEANLDAFAADFTQGFDMVEVTKARLAKELLACIDKDHLDVPPSPI